MKTMVSVLLAANIALVSCAGMEVQQGRKGQVGAVGGGAAGAILGQAIGHNTEATLIGLIAGTALGYIVGNEMDKYDRSQLNHVYERGVSGQPAAWVNPDTRAQYTVTPQPAYTQPGSQQVCRQAEILAVIDGRQEKMLSTACRDAYGRWVLQK